MKQRHIKSKADRDIAIKDIGKIEPPFVIMISREKQRSEGQNSRYWATVDEWLTEIRKYVDAASDKTGYTPNEIRKIIAEQIGWPESAILAILTKKAAHEAMKTICGVPTTVKLGTKEFQNFEQIMDATFADILGTVRAETMRMM